MRDTVPQILLCACFAEFVAFRSTDLKAFAQSSLESQAPQRGYFVLSCGIQTVGHPLMSYVKSLANEKG
jgi:hypothetical protein